MSINLLSLRNDLSPSERNDARDMVQYKLENASWSYTDDTGGEVNWYMSDHYAVDVVGGDLALTPHERTGFAQFERFIGEQIHGKVIAEFQEFLLGDTSIARYVEGNEPPDSESDDDDQAANPRQFASGPATGNMTGLFGRQSSPFPLNSADPVRLSMDDSDIESESSYLSAADGSDDDSDEEDPLDALARFGEDRQRRIRAAANQNMAQNAEASGLDSILAKNMTELNLSPVVDDAEMRNITGQPETKNQRELARQIANAIAGTSSYTKDDTLDSNGKPRPLSELMRMARVTSLWPVLSQLQREQVLDTPGVLANDRGYISRNILVGTPIKRKRQFVQNAQGRLIYV